MDNQNAGVEYKSSHFILIQDLILSILASLLAILFVRWLSEPIAEFTHIVLWDLGTALIATLIGSLISGSHRMVKRYTRFRSSVRLVKTIVLKEILMILLFLFIIRIHSLAHSVLVIMTDVFLTAVFLFYSRFIAIIFSRYSRETIKNEASKRNTMVFGTDSDSVALAEKIYNSEEFNFIGFLSRDSKMSGRVIDDYVVYYCNSEEDYKSLDWRLGGIDCVLFPKRDNSAGGYTNKHAASEEIVKDGLSTLEKGVKRMFDASLSAILILIFFPLGLISAIAIKLDDGKDIFFKQERIGKNGKPFTILKFRTMKMDAEASGAQLFKGEKDTRLTKTGKFLRNYHLDELPQLLNVFKGDMSFVGYRPERQVFIDQIIEHNPRYRYLYQIKPGVTSYATLYNGYTDTIEKMLTRLDLDLYYVRNHSLLFDAKILGLTFLSIVSGKKF